MAKTDTLSGSVRVCTDLKLATVISTTMTATPTLSHGKVFTFTDGTGTDQAQGWVTGAITVTTGGITLSLADSADPFSTGGDDVPENGFDPEASKIKAIIIENTDPTNFVTLGNGANKPTDILGGTTPTLRIHPSGVFAYIIPKGTLAINDGVDDELVLTADTASCICKVSVLYG